MVIPITMVILFTVLLVSTCIGESPGGEVMGEEAAQGTVDGSPVS